MSGSWHSGRTIAGAASLAVKRINRDASLLGGKTVEYVLLDGGCNATQGLKVAMTLLEDARIGAIIGPGALPIWCGVLQLVSGVRIDSVDSVPACSGCDVACEATVRFAPHASCAGTSRRVKLYRLVPPKVYRRAGMQGSGLI